jgi:hypothetical protein
MISSFPITKGHSKGHFPLGVCRALLQLYRHHHRRLGYSPWVASKAKFSHCGRSAWWLWMFVLKIVGDYSGGHCFHPRTTFVEEEPFSFRCVNRMCVDSTKSKLSPVFGIADLVFEILWWLKQHEEIVS